MKFMVHGTVTVSAWTEVEADTADEAREIAEQRELASLCHQPFTGEQTEEWHFDDDGEPNVVSVEAA